MILVLHLTARLALEHFRGRDDISALYYGFVWKSKQDGNVYTPSSARDGMARYGYWPRLGMASRETKQVYRSYNRVDDLHYYIKANVLWRRYFLGTPLGSLHFGDDGDGGGLMLMQTCCL